jgi:hypothetical protein
MIAAGECGMRTAFRIVNVLVWLVVWLAVAISYDAFGNTPRLMGQAVIPLLLCLVIDRGLRGRRVPNPN